MTVDIFPRKAEDKIRRYLLDKTRNKDVLVVTGARQVGKSTLINKVLANSRDSLCLNLAERQSVVDAFDSLKDFSDFERYLSDAFNFKPGSGRVLFIDEAQLSLKLGDFVRFMKEKWGDTSTILSGSMVREIFKKRFPVGRVEELTIRPFTFEEYLQAQGSDSLLSFLMNYQPGEEISDSRHELLLGHLNAYFETGGLPAVIRSRVLGGDYQVEREKILGNYRDDFRTYFGIEGAALAWKTFQSVCFNAGSSSKYTQVVPANEPEYAKVGSIFSCLEAWDLVLKVIQKAEQPEKDLHPKRYLFDMGILRQLRYLARPLPQLGNIFSAENNQALGGLFENFLAMQLAFAKPSLIGYRTSSYEIDFIFQSGQSIIPVEIKASLRNKRNYISALKLYMKQYDCSSGICFTLAKPLAVMVDTELHEKTRKKKIWFLPAYLSEEIGRLNAY